MKKLKYFICFAAVLFLTAQFAAAQSAAGLPHNVATGNDSVSELKNASSGRFNNDVDSFFHVNRWSDFGMTKWFSFLQMGDISSTAGSVWEGGLGIKLTKAYVSVYYNGRFNRGVESQGVETTNTQTGVTTDGYDVTGPANYPYNGAANQGINRNNFFGILVGFGTHGVKFTVRDTITTFDAPVYTSAGFPYAGAGGVSEAVAADATGKYLYRNGSITPKIQWGSATDMAFGKYKTKPSAAIALEIGFNEQLFNFTDPDGTVHHVGNYNGNYLVPTISFDTGGIKFFEGDWGKLSFGATEDFNVRIPGEGNQHLVNDSAADTSALAWGNKLAPYARFEYLPTKFFKLGAELNVPVHVGWNPNTAYYFGIGAKGTDQQNVNALDNNNIATYLAGDWSTIKTGFQLGLGFVDDITGKPSLLKQLNLNWGIKINLPAFAAVGTVTDTSTQVTQNEVNVWYPAAYLQEFSMGLTFFITDKILIDAGLNLNPTTGTDWRRWGLTESVVLGRVLFSIKH